jgi:hypothetical protein
MVNSSKNLIRSKEVSVKSTVKMAGVAIGIVAAFSGCRPRNANSQLQDSLAGLNLEDWPAARPLVVDATQLNVNSTYYYNPAVDGALTKLQVKRTGLTQFSISNQAVQQTPFSDADNNGQPEFPRLLIYKEGSGPNDLNPVFNGAGEIPPGSSNTWYVSYNLPSIDTADGDTYYIAFLHHPNVKFNNNHSGILNVNHTPINEVNQPELEIPVAGDANNGFNHNSTVRVSRPDVKFLFKLDSSHTGNPMGMQFDTSIYRPDGNCDNRVSTAFIFEDTNGQGRVELVKDGNPCVGFDGSGGFNLTQGGKYTIEVTVKNPTGANVGSNNLNFNVYQRGTNPNLQPMAVNAFPNGGVIDVSPATNNRRTSMPQNGIVTADVGFKGKFSGIQGRAFVDINMYGNMFVPLNSTTTTRRPGMLVITNSANANRVEIPLGNGNNPSGETIMEVKDGVEYTMMYVGNYGPDVTGNIRIAVGRSQSILPPRTPNVERLEQSLADVPSAKQAENFYFPNSTDYKDFVVAQAQQGRFFFVEHMPPNNTIPPNDRTGKYPNETLELSPTTGRPLMRQLVFYAMRDIRFNWHKAQDADDINNASQAELRYVDRGTISACLGNTAEHWSDLILHFYCQFGQMRGCYTNYLRAKAPTLAQITDPAQRVAAANMLRMEGFETCIVSGDQLGNIDAKTAQNTGKIGEYEWRWVKNRRFKYPDPVNGPNEASMAAVFQYVMASPTFRYFMDHEQDVINAFYRVDNPSDQTSCSTLRLPRGVENTQANYCVPSKKHNSLLAPAAR